jgi:hypothetical protein
MIRLKEQVASMTPDVARQFRTLLHEIREEEHPSKIPDFKRLGAANLVSPSYVTAPFAYPDFERSGSIPETVAFDGISTLPISKAGSVHRQPESGNTTDPGMNDPAALPGVPGTNRDLLVALNTSFCDVLSGATGKMLGSDSNIAIQFVKAVVELGAERLIEKHSDFNSAPAKLPLDIRALLLPKTFVKEKVATFLPLRGFLLERPKVLAFGFRADVENARINAILARGDDPSDSTSEGHIDDKPHRESRPYRASHPDPPHPKEFHPMK